MARVCPEVCEAPYSSTLVARRNKGCHCHTDAARLIQMKRNRGTTALLPLFGRLLLRREWVAAGYVLGWGVVKHLPEAWGRGLFRRAAHTVGYNKQLAKNLTRVLGRTPTLEEIRDGLASYARYWYEAFALDRVVPDALNIDGIDNLDPSRGAVITLTHSGNWDLAGVALVREVGGLSTVAEHLRPDELYQAFVAYRENLGFTVYPHDEHPMGHLEDDVRAGAVVAMMGERDLKGHGVTVTFFGEKSTFPVGPAVLAQRAGVPLHVADVYFTDSGWGLSLRPAIEVTTVEETAQRIANEFEETVGAHPTDWHMLQPIWVADR